MSYYADSSGYAGDGTSSVDARKLWAGGLATALVAALVGAVAVLIVRGVLGIEVIGPHDSSGSMNYVGAAWLAGFAALAALLATVLAHLLLLVAPRPMAFFGWIVALVTAVFVAWPFTTGEAWDVKIANALVYLVIGIAIGSLVSGMASRAIRQQRPRYPYPQRDETRYYDDYGRE